MHAQNEAYELQGRAAKYTYPSKRSGCRLKRAWARKSRAPRFGFTERSALLSQLGLWNCSQDSQAKRFGVFHSLRRSSLSWRFRQASRPGPGHMRSALLLDVRPRRNIERCRCWGRDLRHDCLRGRPSARRHWRFSRSCSPAVRPLAFKPPPRRSTHFDGLFRTLAARGAQTNLYAGAPFGVSRLRTFGSAA